MKTKNISRIIFVFSLCIFIFFVSCKKNTAGKSDTDESTYQTSWAHVEPGDLKYPSKPAEDFLLVTAKDYDVTLYKNISTSNSVSFLILSSKEIGTDFTLKIDNIQTSYTYSVAPLQENMDADNKAFFPDYLFKCYQNYDWKLYHDLKESAEKNGYNTQEYAYYNEYNYLYEDAYSQFAETDLPQFYRYEISIAFDIYSQDLGENEEINQITLTINGENKVYDIGKIVLDYTTANNSDSTGMSQHSSCQMGGGISPNREGEAIVKGAKFTCQENITLTGVKVLGSNAEIKEVSFNVVGAAGSVDMLWNGEPMRISKFTEIAPVITITDPNLAGKITYNINYVIVMTYEIDGTEYSAFFDVSFLGLPDAFELYAYEVDGIDVISYYEDYFSCIS